MMMRRWGVAQIHHLALLYHQHQLLTPFSLTSSWSFWMQLWYQAEQLQVAKLALLLRPTYPQAHLSHQIS